MKSIFRLALPALLCVINLTLSAQRVKVEGVLKDSISNANLPYSNIILLSPGDSLIDGCMTNGRGEFRLRVSPEDQLFLKARSLGYQTKIIPLDFESGQEDIILEIRLAPDTSVLNEVSISAQNHVITKFDRKVYRINEVKKAAARDIFDLLRTLPGVVVDEENNVRYKGTSPEIMVDDMPAKYIYPDIAMVPVDNVEKVELIDASMRSGGDGTGGIINIKLKKATSDGFSGASRIRSGINDRGDRSSSNGYINLNYKKDKILIFNNFWFYDNPNYNERRTEGTMTYGQEHFDYHEHSESTYKWDYTMDYLGMQIQFSDKTKMMISGGINRNGNYGSGEFSKTMNLNNTIYQKYDTESEYDYESISASTSAYIRHSFDSTLRELTAYVSFSFPEIRNNNSSKSIYNREIEDSMPVNTQDVYSSLSDDADSRAYYSIYYNHPINKDLRWNARYRGSHHHIIKDYYEQSLNGVPMSREQKNTSGYTNSQNLSLRFGGKFGKWKLDAGLKQEYQKYDIDFEHVTDALTDTIISINRAFYNIEPSMNIYFEVDSLQDIKLTFSRTIRRPYYSQLDAFVSKSSPHSWSSGNPDLKESFYNNAYLSYSLNKPMWNMSAELFYSQTNNARTYVSYPVSETIFMSRPENIAYQSRIGLDMSAFYSFSGKHSLSFSSSLYHSSLDASGINDQLAGTGYTVEDVIKKDFGYTAKLTSTFKITKSTSAMAYVQYKSSETNLKGYDYGSINSYASFTQYFFKRKLQLSFSVNNLLDDLMVRGSYRNYLGVEETTETLYSSWYARSFSLSIKYRFRYGDRNTSRIGQNQQ